MPASVIIEAIGEMISYVLGEVLFTAAAHYKISALGAGIVLVGLITAIFHPQLWWIMLLGVIVILIGLIHGAAK